MVAFEAPARAPLGRRLVSRIGQPRRREAARKDFAMVILDVAMTT